MKGATITNWLTKRSAKRVTKKVQADVSVAPNSLLAMDLSLNEVALSPGTYTFHSQAGR